MKVLVIESIVKPVTREQRQEIMRQEVADTFKLYLDEDRAVLGRTVFRLNVELVEQAKETLETLPLLFEGLAQYEFVHVGPLLLFCHDPD